ncbi:MAG: TonB-dependent receptor [Bacteroidota bacterium]
MKSRINLFAQLLPVLACLILSSGLAAQQLNGKVTDPDGRPVIGAFVNKKGTEIHTHADEFGRFSMLGIVAGDTIRVSLLGYSAEEFLVGNLAKNYLVELEEAAYDLGEVVVRRNTKDINVVSRIDLEVTPVRSSQEILRKVPGLFIGQHAGGGKAEQIFLRGFDIDHGTDIDITVDGMPVNMVSHAHGQGYADMHWLIPETIESIDFGKGPYYADRGNFATAGYVGFKTKDRLRGSTIGLDVGQFNTIRALGMFNILDTTNQSAYVASEYLLTDGPFEASQEFSRLNLMGKYTRQLKNGTKFSLLASHFTSEWDASGQIPQRAVDQGLITRFGAIDDTEGGNTSRTNIAVSTTTPLSDGGFLQNSAYFSHYDFELFSNFTFFLEDPVNADQIRQTENRNFFGLQSVYNRKFFVGTGSAMLRVGGGLRADENQDVGLSRTANRKTLLEQIQLGDIQERNFFGFASADFEFGSFLIQPALRYDYFSFGYKDQLSPTYSNETQTKGAFSPKLNFIYEVNNNVQLFAKTGIGFHSNDTRVVLANEADEILPAAFGADLGGVFKPARRLIVNAALWYLFLEQEFVYVGDAGIVEPSGQTRRQGIDFGFRYQLTDWLYANADYTYTNARAIEEAEGEDRIPLAPVHTATGGVSVQTKKFNSSLQFRYLGDRAANEDNSIVAEGYTVFDLNANYTFDRFTVGFIIENLTDVDWNETQFATESRLFNETEPVEEIHFTPGTPFWFKTTLRYSF